MGGKMTTLQTTRFSALVTRLSLLVIAYANRKIGEIVYCVDGRMETYTLRRDWEALKAAQPSSPFPASRPWPMMVRECGRLRSRSQPPNATAAPYTIPWVPTLRPALLKMSTHPCTPTLLSMMEASRLARQGLLFWLYKMYVLVNPPQGRSGSPANWLGCSGADLAACRWLSILESPSGSHTRWQGGRLGGSRSDTTRYESAELSLSRHHLGSVSVAYRLFGTGTRAWSGASVLAVIIPYMLVLRRRHTALSTRASRASRASILVVGFPPSEIKRTVQPAVSVAMRGLAS